jgi:hypothetical protein
MIGIVVVVGVVFLGVACFALLYRSFYKTID